MFHNFKNVETAQQKCLTQPIDNRDGNLRIGLRSMTYTVGWFNIDPRENNTWSKLSASPGELQRHQRIVTPGPYGFKVLKEVIEHLDGIILELNKENGSVTLTVAGQLIYLTDRLTSLLGLHAQHHGWCGEGIHTGTRPVGFANNKMWYVYLDEIIIST